MLLILLNITHFFLVVLLISWIIYGIKLWRSQYYQPYISPSSPQTQKISVSVIVPVVDEPAHIWQQVLESIQAACQNLTYEIIVVANGAKSIENAQFARKMGLTVLHLGQANKRLAVAEGAKQAQYDISIILDSDTIVTHNAVIELLKPFTNPKIGGATPKQVIFERNKGLRWLSDWLEDLRFEHLVKGQSVGRSISCLPGRLFAMRTHLLKDSLDSFLNEYFLGQRCVTGDDRFLTSFILKQGYETIYQESALVYTDAPTNLKKFTLQRLRWSRSGLRETLLSLDWIWQRPYMTFTIFSELFLRWTMVSLLILLIINTVILPGDSLLETRMLELNLNYYHIILLILSGAFLNSILRQIPHLIRYPQDIIKLPRFFLLTIFVLWPVEIYGNITCFRDKWMTRNTTTTEEVPQKAMAEECSETS